MLSWKPKRRGPVYCSPACGYGCTVADYEAAMERAKGICRILGKGWKPEVHENMGWSAKASRGELKVAEFNGRAIGYFAGREPGGILGRGNTPIKAIEDMVRELESRVEVALTILESVNKDLA